MPSLRRTLSSPSVRSCPYTYSSSAATTGHPTRVVSHPPRRSSGSETANRRVLADIDWWLVHDIERDFVPGPPGADDDEVDQGAAENVQVRHGDALDVPLVDALSAPSPVASPPAATIAAPSVGGSYEGDLLSSPLWDVSTDDSSFGMSSPEAVSPLPQFASLSIAPRTPLRRHASTSSQSSVESTPEDALCPLPTYLDVLRPMAPAYPPAFATSLAPRRPANARAPALATRSVSYSAVEFQLSAFSRFDDDPFGEDVPAPPPFFSSTMEDNEMDDLFY
ncbi:hypothetical protein C8Q70DRAFT_1048873 [Cubamyces menziesii]|nr:hypothetical protein C8Q70DRAFT_1048873 [Cubamyces menziesii]